jgi:hypothetical protein
MRSLPCLLAVLLASACAGGDDTATETVTVTTATTVTVTETGTGTTTPATTPTSTTPPRLPSPLPADGTLPVDAFNSYTESIDEPWEHDLAALTDAFVEGGASDATQRSFQATSSGEGAASASATLTLGGLLDDSVRALRYDLVLSARDDGTWTVDSASWSQRCQEGRGHQGFSAEPCL